VFPKIYERFSDQLDADQLVILTGKLSFREDEDPKLLVDSVQPLTEQTASALKLQKTIAVAQKTIGTARQWTHNPQKSFARLSDDNMQTIIAYPDADEETEVDETLLDRMPQSL
jgi:DNA polymerase III alpha subunit